MKYWVSAIGCVHTKKLSFQFQLLLIATACSNVEGSKIIVKRGVDLEHGHYDFGSQISLDAAALNSHYAAVDHHNWDYLSPISYDFAAVHTAPVIKKTVSTPIITKTISKPILSKLLAFKRALIAKHFRYKPVLTIRPQSYAYHHY